MPRRRYVILATAIAAAPILAQGFRGRGIDIEPNVKYDGRFTFVRLRYQERYSTGWAFDYPAMERHFMKVVKEITTVGPTVDGSNIYNMDDPELHRFPMAYLSEPGYWVMSDEEAKGLREYLLKGGFLFVDDFMGREWFNFEEKMLRVQVIGQRVSELLAGLLFQADGADGRLRYEIRIPEGGELHHADALAERFERGGGQARRKARLADAARARQRQEPVAGEQLRKLRELALPAGERSGRFAQIGTRMRVAG